MVHIKDIRDCLANFYIKVIFSSNHVEYVGLGYEQTLQLCRKSFAGKQVLAEDIGERATEYQIATKLIASSDGDRFTNRDCVCSRRVIIQYAPAFEYINEIVRENQLLTETLILKAH